MIYLIVLAALVVAVLLWLMLTYNRLVRLRNEAQQGFSGIDIQLKRRASLIPNLVETVRGYASHERETFENVTRARAETLQAQGPAEAGAAENHMQQALKSIFAVAEDRKSVV